ncbi:MAG: penicillin-binding protein 2, partial [Bdellovibrionales bacterium]|nr:penicillin-binding protein 2 [Bdellovibrionales bacterium]
NKVIQDHYPPGSTFKPIVALAALEENVIGPNTLVYSPSQIRFGRRFYHNHSRTNYGEINVKQALEVSSNIFFYKMGISLGINNIAKYAKALGIGQKTDIQLGNEVSGLMPTEEWKKEALGEEWQPGENLSNAIGQGFVLTTPLQMVLAYNAIGQNGKLYKPMLVKQVISHQNKVVQTFDSQLVRDLMKPDHEGAKPLLSERSLKTVREGMRRVANGDRGTARWWKVPGIELAGKTGTVQVRSFSADQIYDKCLERPLNQRHHGWFIAFAPAENPVITVAVLAERACAGSSGGAPIVRDVIQAFMEKYHSDWLKNEKKLIKKVESESPVNADE